MARIRSIKPEYWSSPGMKGLDPWSRLLFIAMWNWADDYGCGTAIPKELGGFAFPEDEEISSADIRRMLGEIRRAFGVVFYEVTGRQYYYIPSWEKHQKVDKRSARRHPTPDRGVMWNPDPSDRTWSALDQQERSGRRTLDGVSANPPETPSNGRGDLGAGTEEQRNRGTTTTRPPTEPVDTSVDDGLFTSPEAKRVGQPAKRKAKAKPDEDPKWKEFWYDAYPSKAGRIPALAAWVKATVDKKVDPDLIIAGARRYREKCQRERTDPSKIKMAQGWLNDQRWEDDYPHLAAAVPASSPSVGASSPDSARCPKHPRQPAGSCGPCVSEQVGAPRGRHEEVHAR